MLEAIGREVPVEEQDVVINIRDDETTLYESDSGELFVETPSHTYQLSLTDGEVSASPTVVDTASLSELEPAAREQDELNSGSISQVEYDVMD